MQRYKCIGVLGVYVMDGTTTDADAPTDYAEKAAARAAWEGMEFLVTERDTVRVINVSHGQENAGEHTYTVETAGAEAVACECPADEHYPGPCKHRRAVEGTPAALAAAARAPVMATDAEVREAVEAVEADADASAARRAPPADAEAGHDHYSDRTPEA